MKGDWFECGLCRGRFRSEWSDEDAAKECEAVWGPQKPEDLAVVCDDCYKRIMPQGEPS